MVQHLDETIKTDGAYNDHLDSTLNNNGGEAEGGTVTDATGKIDGADSFDGTDDYLNIADSTSLDISSAITIEAWVKKASGTPPAGTAITDCEGLQAMNNDLAASYYLANDIDCSATTGWNEGTGFDPIGDSTVKFTGNFDGWGYKITDLFINRPTEDYVGLFGYIVGGEIKNVGVEDVDITGSSVVGGLVGNSESGTTIISSYSTGSVIGGVNCGGLVSQNSISGTINNSYSTASATGGWMLGGLVGNNVLEATIINSYSTGAVSGDGMLGGLVGSNNATITNSYYDTNTSGQSDTGKGDPKTTAEMKQQTEFVDWDFVTNWSIEETITYPFLKWERDYLVSKGRDAYSLQFDRSNSTLYGYVSNNEITASVSTPTNWHYIAMIFDGTNQELYLNGSSTTLTPGGVIGTNSANLTIGGTNGFFNGSIDEVRISAVARSDGWIITGYNNQSAPATFYSIGAESDPPNASPASPASPTQLKNNETTIISNEGYTNETNVKLKASVIDENNPEIITLFFEMALSGGSFNSPATPTTGDSCVAGTEWDSCVSKIWYVTSASGDYTSTPYTGTTNVAGLSNAAAYKWQVKACDDDSACGSWVAYNATIPNFTVDTTAPASVSAPTFGTITSNSIIINKPTEVTEEGSGLYQWQARRDSLTELGFNAIATGSDTDAGLSENTQYVYDAQFNDNAGNTSNYGTSASKYTLAGAPTNLAGAAEQTSIALSVDAFPNHTSDSSGYYFANTTNSTNSGWIQTNSWQDTGLTCNTSYSYTVKYRNGDGIETETISLNKTTAACGGGTPPSFQNPPSQPEPTPENPNNNFSIIINNDDEYTNSKTVTLKLNAGLDTERMAISNTEDFKYASQIPYQKEYQWDLLGNPPSPLLQRG
ncbi:MAG: hypothetical protein DRQ24_12295, partial [Candidatus Latescibacterota bacterium]